MPPEDIDKLLEKVSDQQQKTLELLGKLDKDCTTPKPRDGWDKFQIVSAFISGVLLSVVGAVFTVSFHNSEVQRQDKLQKEQAAARVTQNKLQKVDLVTKLIPYLGAGASDDEKREQAVGIFALMADGDPDLTTRIPYLVGGQKLVLAATKANPTSTAVKANSSVQGNPGVGGNVARVDFKPGQGQKAGSTIIFDGFRNYAVAGFSFSSGAIVPWGTDRPDLEAANPDPEHAPAVLFLENDTPPYTAKDWPAGKVPANAGIARVQAERLEEVREAPQSGYSVHYFKPEEGAVYCIRTWDGQHFAKIKITDVKADRIAFEWVYQPSGSRVFE